VHLDQTNSTAIVRINPDSDHLPSSEVKGGATQKGTDQDWHLRVNEPDPLQFSGIRSSTVLRRIYIGQ
jgi:hypothetical protein